MNYIQEKDLDLVFSFINRRYGKIEEVPPYKLEPGFEKFCAVLQQAHSDYYPSVFDKAVYLLIGVNKGHFFSNGNKRLALVVMTFFIIMNGLELREETKNWHKNILSSLVPEYEKWEDFVDFTATDFATYNLSIMIADSGVYGISHDELKRRIHSYLEQATQPFSWQ